MSFSRDSKQKLTTVAAVIIVALLGINAFLLWNKFSQEKVITNKDMELNESERIKADLEKQYYESLSELEEMRGNNEELNEMIDKQKEELKGQKDKIYRMIKDGKSSTAELAAVRQKMAEFKSQLDQYVVENNTLREEKEALTAANSQLTSAKANLESNLTDERKMNEDLVTAKSALVSEKGELESTNAKLNTKVTRASVIDVKSLTVVGEKVRKNGKAVSKKYAKSVDRLKVCFTAEENMVTEGGLERFFIRIINPIGETIAMESKGSGIMKLASGTDEVRYTQVKEVDYDKTEMSACFYWEQPSYKTGQYEVEVYNKGYVAGKTSFKLK
ncbi:MAG: myosin heavy subunit [Polaribacter sp.]|jgi:myosin heavy subunit